MTTLLVGLAAFVVGRLSGLGLTPFANKTALQRVKIFLGGGPGVEE